MAATTPTRRMPKHLKATYLADQEYLLEETRATRWHYFPGPALWLIVFGIGTYLAWADVEHWPGSATYAHIVSTFAGWIHQSVANTRFYLAAIVTVLFLLGLLWTLTRYIRWIRTVYAVTSHRVIVQRGILGRNFDQIPVTQVRGVDVHQTPTQRLLGYGTLRVSSEGGTRVGNEDWEGIPKPFKFQKFIENATEAIQSPMSARPGP